MDRRPPIKPSEFATPAGGDLRKHLSIPSLKVTPKAAPNEKEKRRHDIAYGVDSLEKLVDAFDRRERPLRKIAP